MDGSSPAGEKTMSQPSNPVDLNATVRRIDVDARISLRYYYRIADNLLRQADVFRSEKNVIDLYIVLLRFSSLVSETIPLHPDYQTSSKKESELHREKLLVVLDELESLKPEFQRQKEELNKASSGNESHQLDGLDGSLHGPQESSREIHLPSDSNGSLCP